MPARKKPPGAQQDRRPSRVGLALQVVDGTPAEIPAPPSPAGGLLKSTRDLWDTYWRSAIASAALEVDRLGVLERWIVARDEWMRATNAFRRKRIVEGSQGQPVLNPLASYIASREATMAKCEAELGGSPMARLKLGITVGQAKLTAHELNRMTETADDDQERDVVDAELLSEFEAE
jgi:P27 family predicted phage terminase small subunit